MDTANITVDVQDGASISSDVVNGATITSDVTGSLTVTGEVAAGGKGDKGEGAAVSIGGNTSGTPAIVSSGTLSLIGSNNITLSQSGNSIAIIGGAGGSFNISAGTTSNNVTNAVFSNSNNVSFGLNGSTITGSASFSQSVQTQNMVSLQGSTGAISFSNANGVTFGFNASTITASHNGLTSQSVQTQNLVSINGSTGAISLATGSSLSSSQNGSTITFGLASNITTALQSANANYLTSQSNQAFSAQGGSSAFQTLNFANTNGVSFTNTNGSLGASVRTDYASSDHSHGNPTLALTNLSGTTASASNGLTISLSAAPGGGGADGYNILAAGTQTANTAGSVRFADSNGISFGMSNSTQITASYTVPSTAGLISAVNLSAGTTSNNLSRVTFSDSNGVTFGLNGSVVTATVRTDYQSSNPNYLTSQSNQVLSGSNGSFAFQTATFGNLNGLSFYTSNGSMVGSYTVPTQSVQTQNMVSVEGSTGNIDFANANGVTFGFNASTITASHNGLTSQSNQAFSASGGSSAFQTLNFANSNGVTFSNSNGSVVASHNGLTTARASNDAVGLNTAQSNVTWTVNSSGLSLDARGYAGTNTTFNGANVSGSMTVNSNGVNLSLSAAPGGGGVTPVASASDGSFSFTTLGFSNANNVTFGTSAGSIITASVAAPGAAAENNWINLLGANTAGNTTASGSTIGLSGVNVTLSGTNGSQIIVSGASQRTLSAYQHPEQIFTTIGGVGNGSLSIKNMYVPFNVTGTAMRLGASLSANTNTSATTASANISLWMGIYTLNGSTLSLASSGSANNGFQWSQSASSTANTSINSMRQLTVPMNVNMTPGQYFVAAVISSATTYTNAAFTFYGGNMPTGATNMQLAPIGSGTTQSRMIIPFQGIYTAATSVGPATIERSNINWSSASNVHRAGFWHELYNATY